MSGVLNLKKRPSIKAQQAAALAQLRKASAHAKRDEFFTVIKRARLPMPETEYRFHPERLWRFDYAWPQQMVALEVEGGVWTQGRHSRGKGMLEDMDKYNAAGVLGWVVLRTVPDRLTNRAVEEMLRKVLKDTR